MEYNLCSICNDGDVEDEYGMCSECSYLGSTLQLMHGTKSVRDRWLDTVKEYLEYGKDCGTIGAIIAHPYLAQCECSVFCSEESYYLRCPEEWCYCNAPSYPVLESSPEGFCDMKML